MTSIADRFTTCLVNSASPMDRRRFLTMSAAAMASVATCRAQSTTKPDYKMPDYSNTGAELIKESTPAADGFHFPAEWEKHEACIMVFPPPQNWEGEIPLNQVYQQWADVANTVNEFEPVVMVVRPHERAIAKRLLAKDIERIEAPVNDGWSRDSGPMFVVNEKGERRIAGFTFNGWGGKFPPYKDDALLKARLAKALDTPMYPIDLVLEGGAVTFDGEGTLITTEQCLLNDNRTSRKKADIERLLNQSLGTTKVIWLGKGLEPDPVTDGHVDGIACFAEPGVVLLHTTNDRSDRNFAICEDAKRRLKETRDAKGRHLEVIEIPLTSFDVAHMNFYIGNDCVIVPTSGRRTEDRRPLGILREVFSDREVVGIESRVLGKGGGGIHCITQQLPAVRIES